MASTMKVKYRSGEDNLWINQIKSGLYTVDAKMYFNLRMSFENYQNEAEIEILVSGELTGDSDDEGEEGPETTCVPD